MKQGYCQQDIFFAPTGGEMICVGAASGNDIFPGQVCKVSCEAAIASPPEVTCLENGWDAQASTCDATSGGVSPGGQIAMIVAGLALLCLGTFLYQRYRMKKKGEGKSLKTVPQKRTNFKLRALQIFGPRTLAFLTQLLSPLSHLQTILPQTDEKQFLKRDSVRVPNISKADGL